MYMNMQESRRSKWQKFKQRGGVDNNPGEHHFDILNVSVPLQSALHCCQYM